jgi:small subunit ribosomal protein S19e
MITVYDAPAGKLVSELAKELKNEKGIVAPKVAKFVKSGVCNERPPQQEDFWYIRSAAILRKIYLSEKPLGVQRLRNAFGGKKRRGHKQAHRRKAGGKFIRLMVQQLEKEGFIKKTIKPRKGRIITGKGRKILDALAKKVGA